MSAPLTLVSDIMPDGYTPCTTVWVRTDGHVDDREDGHSFWRHDAYEFVRADSCGRSYSPRELVKLWHAEGFAVLGDLLETYRDNLHAALADGSAREQEPVEIGEVKAA